MIRQNGNDQRAQRLKDRREATVAKEILERYVGRYPLTRNGFELVVTMEGDRRLTAESVGQFKYPLFAESETSFFFKDVDAEIEFAKDPNGAVTLVLHHGSFHEKAAKQ